MEDSVPAGPVHCLVVGPGALGCLLATTLCQRGYRVSLFDHNCDRAEQLRKKGIIQIRGAEKFHVRVPVHCQVSEIHPPDVLFLCVKSSSVLKALRDTESLLHKGNLLITLQNGIAHPSIIDQFFPSLCWAAGVTAMGANLLSAREVVFAGSGRSRFGFLNPCPQW